MPLCIRIRIIFSNCFVRSKKENKENERNGDISPDVDDEDDDAIESQDEAKEDSEEDEELISSSRLGKRIQRIRR